MQQSELHGVLIELCSYSGEGDQVLRHLAREISKFIEILAISSIYRVKKQETGTMGIHDLRSFEVSSGLMAVIKGTTEKSPEDILLLFEQTELKMRSEMMHKSVALSLLTYDGATRMTPTLTLPHVNLHMQQATLVMASEVWGDYFHPVLRESLNSLAQQSSATGWGEFYSQGKTLLDFYPPAT